MRNNYAKKHRKAQNEHIRLSLSVAGDMFFHFCSFIYMGSVEMNIKNLIAVSVRQANVGNVEIIEWAVQRIQDLEQESDQLKELSLKLCDAVDNNDDLPPIKYALKCGYLVNKLREKAQVTK